MPTPQPDSTSHSIQRTVIVCKKLFFLCGSVKLPTVGSRQVLWACTGKNETFPPSTSLPVMGEIAGVNTTSLGGYLHSAYGQRPRVRPGEGWAPPGCTLPRTHLSMTTNNHTIRDRSPPGSTRTAPSAGHQDGGQHHHWHLEHKDTKSCRETSGTNTRNGQMEHPWTL